MGFVATPSTVVVRSVVGWEKRGVATASSMLARALGQTVGIVVFGTTYNQYVTIIGSKTELTAETLPSDGAAAFGVTAG